MNIGMSIVGLSAVQSTLSEIENYGSGGRVEYVVGTNVEYAPYVEFGTWKMQAQPYLRPAAEEVQENVKQYVNNSESLEVAVHTAALELESRAKQKCPVDTGNLRGSLTTRKQ